jgi:hypothetical protein
MGKICKIVVIIMSLLLLFVFYPDNLFSQKKTDDLKTLKGTLFKHTINDKSDSLSSTEITELRGSNGLPIWFSRDFYQEVCLTGLCKMVPYRIYWTGVLTYLGIEVNEWEPLTKSDHSVFKPEDYNTLDRILMDSLSVFRKMKPEDLTVPSDKSGSNEVDGLSGATNPSITSYVVKDAVYTCFTIWNAVYGPTYKKIKELLQQRAGSDYLRLVFGEKDPAYIMWGIEFVKNHNTYHSQFYKTILTFIKSENPVISRSALKYFTPSILTDKEVQHELALLIEEVSDDRKFDIIWLYSTLPDVNNDIILKLLQQYEEDMISSTVLGYVYKTISNDKLKDLRILNKLKAISSDENIYVRNITDQVLSRAN